MTVKENIAEQVSRISRHVVLDDIRTTSMSAKVLAEPPLPGTELGGPLKATAQLHLGDGAFQLRVQFSIRVHAVDRPEPETFFTGSLGIVSFYRLLEGAEDVTEEALRPFARHNGMLHLWPYFRSWVQSACGQLSLPPVLLPLFRPNAPFHLEFAEGLASGGELPER